MSGDLVEPRFKQGGRSPQRQRRAQFEKDYAAGREAVKARSNGWCEFHDCDVPAQVVHHKKGRRVADANHPDNLLALCNAHHVRVHENPAESYRYGYLLRRT